MRRWRQFAYVPNEKTGTLSIIDLAKDEVIGSIQAGKKPRGLVASLDGKTLYVSDQPNNALLIIDTRRAQGHKQDRFAANRPKG